MDLLIERFDAVGLGGTGARSKPTPSSLEKIQDHFGFKLPELLVCLGTSSLCYDNWFAGIGDDFLSGNHIVRINSHWRRRRRTRALPPNLVIFNLGFDLDFDCFDLDQRDPSTGDPFVRYWTPGASVDEPIHHANFRAYLEDAVQEWERERHKYDNRKSRQKLL